MSSHQKCEHNKFIDNLFIISRPVAKGHRHRAPTGRVRPVSPASERISSKRHQQKSKVRVETD